MAAFRVIRFSQTVVEKLLDLLKGNEQRLLVSGLCRFLLTAFPIHVSNRNAMMLGYEHYRIRKGQVFLLHDERDGIAATVAAEAVVQALLWRHREGGRLFRMERAQSDQRRAFPFKADVRFQYLLDVDTPDFTYGGFADHSLVRVYQHSIMDCPEYLGRFELSGLTGLM